MFAMYPIIQNIITQMITWCEQVLEILGKTQKAFGWRNIQKIQSTGKSDFSFLYGVCTYKTGTTEQGN